MISRITPLVQGNPKKRQLLLAHVVGGASGGLTSGLIFGFVGVVISTIAGPWSPTIKVMLLSLALVTLALLDFRVVAVAWPSFFRQTPSTLTCTMGRTLGVAAWGADLGLGFATTPTFYTALALPLFSILAADLTVAVIMLGVFGLLRSVAVATVVWIAEDRAAEVATSLMLNHRRIASAVAGSSVAVAVIMVAGERSFS